MRVFFLLLLLTGLAAAEEKPLTRAYWLPSVAALEKIEPWALPDPFEEPEAFDSNWELKGKGLKHCHLSGLAWIG